MGETKWYYTESYIYNIIDKYISPNICFMHPNYITLFRIIPIILTYKFWLDKQKYLFILMVIISSFTDSIDGSVARECDKKSTFGSYLDIIMDSINVLLLLYLLYISYVNKSIIYFISFIIFLFISKFISDKYLFKINIKTHKPTKNKFIYNLYLENVFLLSVLIGFFVFLKTSLK